MVTKLSNQVTKPLIQMYLTNEHIYSNGDFKGLPSPKQIDLTIKHLRPTLYKCGKCGKFVDGVAPVMVGTMKVADACIDCMTNDAKAREQWDAVLGGSR